MKQLLGAVMFVATFAALPVLAHGDNDHVRGTVTAITADSIVIKTVGTAAPRTLSVDVKTVYLRGGKTAHAADVAECRFPE